MAPADRPPARTPTPPNCTTGGRWRGSRGTPNVAANLAELLLNLGRTDGSLMLDEAERLATSDRVRLKVAFLRYAHDPGRAGEALGEVKRLLRSGERCHLRSFASTVEQARRRGHPEPDLLQALADVVADRGAAEGLDGFPAWQAR